MEEEEEEGGNGRSLSFRQPDAIFERGGGGGGVGGGWKKVSSWHFHELSERDQLKQNTDWLCCLPEKSFKCSQQQKESNKFDIFNKCWLSQIAL